MKLKSANEIKFKNIANTVNVHSLTEQYLVKLLEELNKNITTKLSIKM